LEGLTNLKQLGSAANIRVVVFDGLNTRLSDICIGSEMHNSPGPPGLESSVQVILVPDVAPLERPPFDRPIMASFEIVENNWLESATCQCFACVTSHEARAACYKDGFHKMRCSCMALYFATAAEARMSL